MCVCAAVPLTFDDNHFASVSTLVHSQLLDFKFRPAPNQHAPSPPPPVAMPVASAVGRASAASASSPSPSPSPPPHPSASPPSASSAYALAAASSPAASSPSSPTAVYGRPTFPSHTLGQILFPRLLLARTPRNITPQSTMQLANDYHQLFLTALINSYNQLAYTFEIYSRHCVSGLQRGTLANLLQVSPLVLPSELSPPPHGTAASSPSVCDSTQPGEERASVARRGDKARAGGMGSNEAAPSASSFSSNTLAVPSSSAADTLARSRRSSMECYVHELERHMSPGAEAEELRAKFAMPPLYTLAYRIRHETGCCAWDDPDRATTLLLADLQSVSQQIFTLWNHFQQVLPHCTTQLTLFERAK